MNFVFAPTESRALDFLKHNRFDLDDRAKIRTTGRSAIGEIYTEGDTLYILDGCRPELLEAVQSNVMKARGKPRLISVEER